MRRCLLVVLLFLTACTINPQPTRDPQPSQTPAATDSGVSAPTATATAEPPRVLSICMGGEPQSLFLYADNSISARSVRQAIYDGPYDISGYELTPVILEQTPSIENGGIRFEQVQVSPGDQVQDAQGNIVNLGDGVSILPSECTDLSCAQVYQGQEPVLMDQMVVTFQLLPGLMWSDGEPLDADDSLYSYEVARALYPRVHSELIARTAAYQIVSDLAIEWRGIPGVRDSLPALNFFTPLPRHAWGTLPAEELLTSEAVNRAPVGWGPYVVEEWTAGDHITLARNPNYFRASEGLPHFDNLVFRFMGSSQEAVDALLAGECDYVDETAGLDFRSQQLVDLQNAGEIALFVETGTAWEHITFGIASASAADPAAAAEPAFFSAKETRQAVALCLDRQRILDAVYPGGGEVPSSYVPPSHPLYNQQVRQYAYDPQAGAELLQAAGWVDTDGDPSTPREAAGAAGVPFGTPFEVTFLTTPDEEHQQVAQIIQESLAQCGIRVNISSQPAEELFAPGPDGPVFGRKFAMVQFAWGTAVQPACSLYTSEQIPGSYPQFPHGWGGANAGGYSNPEFDLACKQALLSPAGTNEHTSYHHQAQAIFAEDLPALPLYLHSQTVASRPDLCGVQVDASAESALWNLEAFNYGEGCQDGAN